MGWRWWNGTRPDADDGAEIVVSRGRHARRHADVVAAQRAAHLQPHASIASVPVDLYSILTGSKLVRVNRATQEVEPALAETWTDVARQPDLHADAARRRDLVGRHAVHVGRRAVHLPGDLRPEGRQPARQRRCKIDGKPLTVTAPDAQDRRRDAAAAPSVPASRCSTTCTIAPKHKLEAALKAGTFAQAMGVATPPADLVSIGPFMLTQLRAGPAAGVRSQPALLEEGRGRHPAAVSRSGDPRDRARSERGAGAAAVGAVRHAAAAGAARRHRHAAAARASRASCKLIELGVGADPDLFFFNLRSPYWAKDPRRDWITRKEFRQAISHAIDREAFANTVFLGAGVPIWGPVTPGNQKWFSPNVPRYGYSVERAKEILAEHRPDQSRRRRVARGREGHRGALQRA